jgi:hypothetical protein
MNSPNALVTIEKEEDMIMRISAKESPDSELRLKRYIGKKFRGLKYEF